MQAVLFALFVLVASQLGLGRAVAQDAVVASVHGRPITETDMRYAEIDLGSDLEAIAPENRRRVLLEYLIENQLLSEAAEQARIDREPDAEAHLRYVRRRVLRDRFYDSRFAASVTEEEARELYNREIASAKPEEEIRARHILLLTEQQAREQRARILAGTPFATVAMEVSQDPGNAADGGDLGYFTRGQFDPGFEDAAAILERGVLSDPVQTKFGWHLILVEDKRARPIPSFDELKGSIISLLIQRKALEQVSDLRGKAKIDIRDAEAAGPPLANPSPR